MKVLSIYILIIVSFLLIISCGKRIDKGHTEFIGEWHATDGMNYYKLTIDKNSQAAFSDCAGSSWCGSSMCCDITNGTARIKNDVLIINMKQMTIDMYPEMGADGYMICKLNGIVYTKVGA